MNALVLPPLGTTILLVASLVAPNVCTGADGAGAEKDPRPNILFAIADDWGWPHAGAYGDPVVKTPTFDRLAGSGGRAVSSCLCLVAIVRGVIFFKNPPRSPRHRLRYIRCLKRVGVLTMTPDEALEEQIRRYRQMTGEERLLIALRLHELSCEMAREGIRRQYPEATPEEVERHLHRRLELARA